MSDLILQKLPANYMAAPMVDRATMLRGSGAVFERSMMAIRPRDDGALLDAARAAVADDLFDCIPGAFRRAYGVIDPATDRMVTKVDCIDSACMEIKRAGLDVGAVLGLTAARLFDCFSR